MSDFKFSDREFVYFDIGTTSGCGYVVGACGSEQPIIGYVYMVEVMNITGDIKIPNDTYPFSAMAIPECYIKALS